MQTKTTGAPFLKFSRLKKQVSITAVLKDKGLMDQFRRQEDQLFGCCPIHQGDNPNAFVVSLSKNLYHCFAGCNSGGDVIDLVRRLDGKSFHQTAVYLSSLSSYTKISIRSSPKKNFVPFTRRIPLDHRTRFFHSKRILPTTACRFEAGEYYAHGFLADSVAVRIHDPDGNPLGYAARRLNNSIVQKYGKWNGVVVVEGAWSVMRLNQIGIPAVALLGLHLSELQQKLLAKYNRVVLMLDGDHAGRQAAETLQPFLNNFTHTLKLTLRDGLDPDDLSDAELMAGVAPFFS